MDEQFHDDKDAIILTCASCGELFDWESGEQKFFKEKNLSAPRRCKPCRAANTAKRAARLQGQLDYHRAQETKATLADVAPKDLR